MRGPTNPTFNDVIGLLVNGFDLPPVILNPYNPEYYITLYDGYGLLKAKDLYAYMLYTHNFRSDKLLRLHNAVKERSGATIRQVDLNNKKQLEKDVKILKDIYNAAWEPN